MNFIDFDEESMTLSISQGITTNEDVGIYTIVVKLNEPKDKLKKTYRVKVTIVAARKTV